MRRSIPLAYVTASYSDCSTGAQIAKAAQKYCTRIKEAGYIPICPDMYLSMFLKRNNAKDKVLYMEYINSEEANEDLLFREEVMRQFEYFYQYMHGDRKEPNEVETIFKRSIEFFGADWIGLIDFDLEVGAWSTRCFYNKRTGSSTETLIEDAENAAQAKRWERAIRGGKPIVIEDIESIREEAPEEYAMYKRLHVQSVLGVPYRNCGSGLMVVRNPKRFKNCYTGLNIIAYIVTNEIIAKQRRDNIYRKQSKYEPSSYDTVRIDLFGGITISSKDLFFDEEDMKSESLRFLIAFLACNPGKFFSVECLNSKYEGDKDVSWADLIYKFRIKWKNARNLDDDGHQLILTTEKGYGFNPKLNIVVDVSLAEEMMHVIDDSSDVLAKLKLLRNFYVLFHGEFMGSVFTRNAFIRENRLHYKLKYIEKMEVFMKLLCVRGDYSGAEGYCNDILKVYPDSADIHFWRMVALYKQGCIDSVREIDENLRDVLDERTYSILCRRLQLELNITGEVLEASQKSKGVFLRLDEEKRKIHR